MCSPHTASGPDRGTDGGDLRGAPFVPMMETADLRHRDDPTGAGRTEERQVVARRARVSVRAVRRKRIEG
jgi:hypothetical protein